MIAIFLVAYFMVLGVLALLGLYRLLLTRAAIFAPADAEVASCPEDAPRLVVQVPIYNEAFVAERVIRAAAALRYPAGRLSIQILDDSSDETRAICSRVAAELAQRGVNIAVIRRDDRRGFKAGALAHGLSLSDAELVAIFDADFLPDPDFLEKTVPVLLAREDRGLVQARWTHKNRDVSWLTRAQAIFLDGHFAIEHRARAASGSFFNFNGTAGVWRRSAIEAAGGWSDDTITEDLDLSYRAQLAGYNFCYLDRVLVPAELPERWSAFRTQQARWVRGSVETARKLAGRVLFARALPLRVRIDASIHLFNNFAYLLMAILGLMLPAAVVVRAELGWRVPGGQQLASVLDLTMLGAGTIAMFVFYGAAEQRAGQRLTPLRALEIVFALCVGVGLSVHNAREVLAGLSSKRAGFVRTPKRGDADREAAIARYSSRPAIRFAMFELLFAAYFFGAAIYAIDRALWGAIPFLALYGLGFSANALGALWEIKLGPVAATSARRSE